MNPFSLLGIRHLGKQLAEHTKPAIKHHLMVRISVKAVNGVEVGWSPSGSALVSLLACRRHHLHLTPSSSSQFLLVKPTFMPFN